MRVYGGVQGVGFRWFVQRKAQELAVPGWVRNCPDGTVLIEAEAEQQQLEQLLALVRTGPMGAEVEKVVEEKAGSDELPAAFAILR